MKKLLISLIALLAMFAAALPAAAQEEEKDKKVQVPDAVQITDPPGDANYMGGDWQTGNAPTQRGADVLTVWFTNDAETISLHIQTEAPPGAGGLFFRTYTNPKNSISPTTSASCLVFRTWVEGLGYPSDTNSYVTDGCGEESKVTDGETTFSEGPDGTSILSATYPRTASPYFEEGSIIFTPFLQVWQPVLTNAQIIDNTKPGGDYTVVGKLLAPKKEEPKEEEPEEGEEEGEEEEEPKEEPKPKPKKKKGKKGSSCPAFKPGEKGAGKPTVTVTDAATEEKPLEQKVTLEQSTADVEGDPTYDQFNVVVDSKAAEAGLYATFEFPMRRDYDLELLHTDGSYAARSHGFNPIAEIYSLPPWDGREGHGGNTTASSENLVGIKTADCGGWTVEAVNWLGEGGEFAIKLWLGKPEVDPQAPGEEKP